MIFWLAFSSCAYLALSVVLWRLLAQDLNPRPALIIWFVVFVSSIAFGFWMASDDPLPWVIQSERPAK